MSGKSRHCGLSFDEFQKRYLGQCSWYQSFVVVTVSLMALPLAFSVLDVRFVMILPNFWCSEARERFHQNGSQSLQTGIKSSASSPLGDEPGLSQRIVESSLLRHSPCRVYDIEYNEDIEWTELQTLLKASSGRNASVRVPTRACTKWEFDHSQYESTVATEWELVCEREWLLVVPHYVTLLGMALGSLFCGVLGDLVGRRIVCLSCFVLHALLRVASAFSASFSLYVFLRLTMASTATGVLLSIRVLLLELVCGPWRAFAGLSDRYMTSIGSVFMASLAYGIRDWKILTLALTVPFSPLLLNLVIMPESARWLFIKGYYQAGDRAIQNIAKVNRKTVPNNAFVKIKDACLTEEETSVLSFRYSKILMLKICIFCIVWFVCYGIHQGLGIQNLGLSSSAYISSVLDGVVELSCLVACTWLVNTCMSRRMTLTLSLLLSGNLLLIMLVVLPKAGKSANTALVVLAALAKPFITVSLSTLTLVTMETVPTGCRCLVLGLGMGCGYLGGFLALLLQHMGCSPGVSVIVSGLGCLCTCGLSLLLPETRGRPLPDCLSDADMMPLSIGLRRRTAKGPRQFRESLPLKL